MNYEGRAVLGNILCVIRIMRVGLYAVILQVDYCIRWSFWLKLHACTYCGIKLAAGSVALYKFVLHIDRR